MRTIVIATALSTVALFGCEDTKHEEEAEQDEELTAEIRAEAEGAGPLDRELQGEIAEQRGELARDVGAKSKPMDAPTDCDEVYKHVLALQKGADPLIGGDSEIPAEEPFLEVCEKLPKDVRPCMSLGYVYEHRQECEKAMDALPDDLRAELDEVSSPD